MTTSTQDTDFSARELPWTKLGKLTDTGLTVEQAIKEGGLDFTVSKRAARFEGLDGTWKAAEKRTAIVTDDTDEIFEFVSAKDYKIIQFAEAMQFIGEISPTIMAAGTLRNRRQGFMVVQLPDVAEIAALHDDDPHDLYCVLRTSHDRTRALEIALMPIRGLCMNMLPLASMTKGAKQRWAIPHAGKVEQRMAQAKDAITKSQAYAVAYAETVHRLMNTEMDVEAGEKILHQVIRKSPRQSDTVKAITAVWQNDPTVGYTGSAWGLVNAVSSYLQWERQAPGTTAQSQLTGALSGDAYQKINRTLVRALRA